MNLKKYITPVLSLMLVAALAVGGTLAWLSNTTNVENNTFTLVNMDPDDPALQDMSAVVEEVFDGAKALDLKPSDSVQKEVRITNTSKKDIDEWVAIQLTFQKGDKATPAVMEDLVKVMEIKSNATGIGEDFFDSTTWVRKNSGDLQQIEIFYYNEKIGQNDSTTTLFDKVDIKSSAVNADITTIYSWDGFNIKVDGAAVQGDMADALNDEVKTALDALFN